MSKQEEIKEGLHDALKGDNPTVVGEPCPYCRDTEVALNYLYSQDVMIKVGEISDNLAQTASEGEKYFAQGGNIVMISTPKTVDTFKSFKEAGYVAVIPLIDRGESR